MDDYYFYDDDPNEEYTGWDLDLDYYYPMIEPTTVRHKTVILANGEVWEVAIIWYDDGSHETIRRQLEDTCYPPIDYLDNLEIPF